MGHGLSRPRLFSSPNLCENVSRTQLDLSRTATPFKNFVPGNSRREYLLRYIYINRGFRFKTTQREGKRICTRTCIFLIKIRQRSIAPLHPRYPITSRVNNRIGTNVPVTISATRYAICNRIDDLLNYNMPLEPSITASLFPNSEHICPMAFATSIYRPV